MPKKKHQKKGKKHKRRKRKKDGRSNPRRVLKRGTIPAPKKGKGSGGGNFPIIVPYFFHVRAPVLGNEGFATNRQDISFIAGERNRCILKSTPFWTGEMMFNDKFGVYSFISFLVFVGCFVFWLELSLLCVRVCVCVLFVSSSERRSSEG